MTAKFVALLVAAVLLSACETTSVSDVGPGPKKRLVTRGEVVPDEPAHAAQGKKATVKKAAVTRTASAAKPVRPRAPAVPAGEMAPVIDSTDSATPTVTAPSSGGTGTGTGSGTGSDAGSGTSLGADTSTLADASATVPSDVTATPIAPIEPATVSAEPAGTTPPSPSPFAIDFRDMMNATIAGFPLWLMVVVGIILAGALVFGTGGRRERPRDERDYEERTYAERDRHYDDGPRDAEPEPA